MKWIRFIFVILTFFFLLGGSYYYFDQNQKLKVKITNQKNQYDSLSIQQQLLNSELANLRLESIIYNERLETFQERDRTIRNEVLFFTDVELYKYKNEIDSINVHKEESLHRIKDEYENLGERLLLQSNSYDDLTRIMKENKSFLLSIPIIKPIQTKDMYTFSSNYGMRIDPFDTTLSFHEGIDITTYENAPVLATGWGRVEKITYSKYGYGNKVLINHNFGYKSLYAHLNKIYVKEGQIVSRGQIIALAGNTGRSTGVHLHYEVYKDNKHVDPIQHFFSYETTRNRKFKHLIILQK